MTHAKERLGQALPEAAGPGPSAFAVAVPAQPPAAAGEIGAAAAGVAEVTGLPVAGPTAAAAAAAAAVAVAVAVAVSLFLFGNEGQSILIFIGEKK